MKYALIILLFVSCGKKEEEPVADQNYQDYGTAYSIAAALDQLYKLNISGKTTSEHDINATCALGGTSHITGKNTKDSKTYFDLDLVMDSSACRISTRYCQMLCLT